jgi:hypothetical protein
LRSEITRGAEIADQEIEPRLVHRAPSMWSFEDLVETLSAFEEIPG